MRIRLVLCAAGCFVGIAGNAYASSPGVWPTYAHDFARTSRADGSGSLHTPAVAWTKSLGGSLAGSGATVTDIDGDGRDNVVTVTGGRVVASNPDGTTLWKSALSGPRGILGVWPLHGSTLDVVVDTPGGVQVLSGTDGHVLTTLAMNAPSNAIFVPEGGDASTGGILVLATSRGPVSGFDFRSATNVTTPLWTFTGNNQTNYLAGDIDGDGVPDLIHPLDSGFEIDDPLTGTMKYSDTAMSPAAYFYLYELANVDGMPGDEIIVFDTSYLYSPQTGVYVLGVRSGALTVLWSDTVASTNALDADTYSIAGSAIDLDGDGNLELVYSRWSTTAGKWTTKIADAATGTALASLSGEFLQAITDVDGDGKLDVMVRNGVTGNQTPPRSTIQAYDFDSRATGAVAKSWSLSLARVLTVNSLQQPGPWTLLPLPIAADFDTTHAGNELLVAQDGTNHGDDTQYGLLHGSDGSLTSAVAVAPTVDPTALGWGPGLTSATSKNDVVVFTADGVVHVETSGLSQTTTFPAGSFSNWVYTNARSSGGNLLFATTSNNHLEWLDATHLHSDGTPYEVFDEPSIFQQPLNSASGYPLDPVVLLQGSGSPTYVSFETTQTASSTTVSVVAHDPTGIELWRSPLSAGAQVVSPGAYAVDVTGDGFPDLVIPIASVSSVESLAIYNGSTGQLVRSTPLASILAGSDHLASGSLIDVNGDQVPDLVAPEHANGVLAVDLTQNPMSQIWLIPRGTSNTVDGTIGVAQLDGQDAGAGDAGSAQTLFRVNGNNGFGPYERYTPGGSVLASVAQGFPGPNAFDENTVAVVQRGDSGAFDLVSVGTGGAGLSRVRRLTGDTLSTVWTEYAAHGSLSTTAPSQGYALHGPVEVDVDGDGTEDVVFGSDDGYLYAVRSTDGSLTFSLNLNAPVDYVIAANVDQDPALELVASLADGRLVAIDDNYTATKDPPDGGADAGADATVDGGDAAANESDGAADGTVADGGANDAAADGDAGALDGAADGTIDGAPTGSVGGSGGCGCETAGRVNDRGGILGAALLIGFAAIRITRRRKRDAQ